jgi:molecular chaperone GrpE
MIDNDKPRDEAVEKELEGVPEEFLDKGVGDDGDSTGDALDSLRADLEAAEKEMLYAKAEVQNVRRRMEKDIQDARTYAATGFARDMLAIADNLERALAVVPEGMREDETAKNFLAGIDATKRELEKVFAQHGISRIAAVGLPLDPNQHQAMMEIPSAEAEPGTVVQEMQSGWMIKDRLLRPAMVGVARKPD